MKVTFYVTKPPEKKVNFFFILLGLAQPPIPIQTVGVAVSRVSHEEQSHYTEMKKEKGKSPTQTKLDSVSPGKMVSIINNKN